MTFGLIASGLGLHGSCDFTYLRSRPRRFTILSRSNSGFIHEHITFPYVLDPDPAEFPDTCVSGWNGRWLTTHLGLPGGVLTGRAGMCAGGGPRRGGHGLQPFRSGRQEPKITQWASAVNLVRVHTLTHPAELTVIIIIISEPYQPHSCSATSTAMHLAMAPLTPITPGDSKRTSSAQM